MLNPVKKIQGEQIQSEKTEFNKSFSGMYPICYVIVWQYCAQTPAFALLYLPNLKICSPFVNNVLLKDNFFIQM